MPGPGAVFAHDLLPGMKIKTGNGESHIVSAVNLHDGWVKVFTDCKCGPFEFGWNERVVTLR